MWLAHVRAVIWLTRRQSLSVEVAWTRKKLNILTWPDSLWQSYGKIRDADIFVKHDLIYWPATTDTEKSYDFWCDTATQGSFETYQLDYQTIMAHELGHAVGFEHRTDALYGPCMMHPQQRRGRFNRIMCSDEIAAYKDAY